MVGGMGIGLATNNPHGSRTTGLWKNLSIF